MMSMAIIGTQLVYPHDAFVVVAGGLGERHQIYFHFQNPLDYYDCINSVPLHWEVQPGRDFWLLSMEFVIACSGGVSRLNLII